MNANDDSAKDSVAVIVTVWQIVFWGDIWGSTGSVGLDGLEEGRADGEGESAITGLLDGLKEGRADGTDDSVTDGDAVAPTTGLAVGILEIDGVNDGSADGLALGSELGAEDTVGIAEGASDAIDSSTNTS